MQGASFFIVIAVAVVAVGVFALVMAAAMVRGGERNPDTEIGTNPRMRERGIECPAAGAHAPAEKGCADIGRCGDCASDCRVADGRP